MSFSIITQFRITSSRLWFPLWPVGQLQKFFFISTICAFLNILLFGSMSSLIPVRSPNLLHIISIFENSLSFFSQLHSFVNVLCLGTWQLRSGPPTPIGWVAGGAGGVPTCDWPRSSSALCARYWEWPWVSIVSDRASFLLLLLSVFTFT